jgi:hypothetical protein
MFGILWYDSNWDNSMKVLATAAAHYRRKMGVEPNLAHVHPETLAAHFSAPGTPAGWTLVADQRIQRNHVLIGVAE